MDKARRSTPDLPRWYVVLWSVLAQVILVCGTLLPVMSYGVWRVATVFLFVSAIVGREAAAFRGERTPAR